MHPVSMYSLSLFKLIQSTGCKPVSNVSKINYKEAFPPSVPKIRSGQINVLKSVKQNKLIRKEKSQDVSEAAD